MLASEGGKSDLRGVSVGDRFRKSHATYGTRISGCWTIIFTLGWNIGVGRSRLDIVVRRVVTRSNLGGENLK